MRARRRLASSNVRLYWHSVPHAGHQCPVVDVRIRSAIDDQESSKPPLHTGQRMIHDRVVPGHVKLKLSNYCTAGWHGNGLNAFQRRSRQTAEIVDLVEYLPDDVERRREIRTAYAEEEPHCFTNLGMQGMQFRNRAHGTV